MIFATYTLIYYTILGHTSPCLKAINVINYDKLWYPVPNAHIVVLRAKIKNPLKLPLISFLISRNSHLKFWLSCIVGYVLNGIGHFPNYPCPKGTYN